MPAFPVEMLDLKEISKVLSLRVWGRASKKILSETFEPEGVTICQGKDLNYLQYSIVLLIVSNKQIYSRVVKSAPPPAPGLALGSCSSYPSFLLSGPVIEYILLSMYTFFCLFYSAFFFCLWLLCLCFKAMLRCHFFH